MPTVGTQWDREVSAPTGVRVRLVADPAGGVRWRLLAGNGRVLAVAPRSDPDAVVAEDALIALIRTAATLVPSIKHPASSVEWTWAAVDPAGTTVATGDRSYARYGTCLSSFARFRTTITELTGDDVRTLFRRLEPGQESDKRDQ